MLTGTKKYNMKKAIRIMMSLLCELPPFIETVVTYTEPGFAGNTATNAMKDATVEPGVNVRVPLFIKEGERIKVDTRTGEYSERIK